MKPIFTLAILLPSMLVAENTAPTAREQALDQAALTNSAAALGPTIESMADSIYYTPPAKPEKNFTVHDTTIFQQDGRTITFNKVAPPIREPKPVRVQSSPTPEQFAEMQRMAPKSYISFTFFGTVWDEKITEVEWFYEGIKYQAFVNVDLSFLHAMSRFETGESYYSITGMLGHSDSDKSKHWIPTRANFNGEDEILYMVLEPEQRQVSDEALKSLEALLAFYESNKESLWLKYTEQHARNLARQRYYEANPPSRDIEISFWKKEGGEK